MLKYRTRSIYDRIPLARPGGEERLEVETWAHLDECGFTAYAISRIGTESRRWTTRWAETEGAPGRRRLSLLGGCGALGRFRDRGVPEREGGVWSPESGALMVWRGKWDRLGVWEPRDSLRAYYNRRGDGEGHRHANRTGSPRVSNLKACQEELFWLTFGCGSRAPDLSSFPS